jgi:predicted phosphate transport protein (TIGR00153 family)
MFSRLIPKEFGFFDMLNSMCALITDAAKVFETLVQEESKREALTNRLKELEHQADAITHTTIEMLHKAFITPLDRDDIFELIKALDNIMDILHACGQRIYLYKIGAPTPELQKLADTAVRGAGFVKIAVEGLRNLKHIEDTRKACVAINQAENEADHILRAALAQLLNEEPDMRRVIKLKEIFEFMESVTDRCEEVASLVEGILMDYA